MDAFDALALATERAEAIKAAKEAAAIKAIEEGIKEAVKHGNRSFESKYDLTIDDFKKRMWWFKTRRQDLRGTAERIALYFEALNYRVTVREWSGYDSGGRALLFKWG